MLAGVLGAVLTVWVTFVPCFLWIFAGAPYIEALRGRGETVIEELPGHGDARSELDCDRRLVRRDGRWAIEKL